MKSCNLISVDVVLSGLMISSDMWTCAGPQTFTCRHITRLTNPNPNKTIGWVSTWLQLSFRSVLPFSFSVLALPLRSDDNQYFMHTKKLFLLAPGPVSWSSINGLSNHLWVYLFSGVTKLACVYSLSTDQSAHWSNWAFIPTGVWKEVLSLYNKVTITMPDTDKCFLYSHVSTLF